MRTIIVAVCVAFSAIAAISAAAQSPADEQQRAAAAEIERLRSELEQARARLEAGARELASRSVPAPAPQSAFALNSDYAVLFGGASRASAPLGAALVDAEGGALVTEVVPGGGASDAGIRVGDLIQSIEGFDLSAEDSPYAEMLERLAEIEPGDSVSLAVERAGEVLEYDVELAEGYPLITMLQSPQNRYGFFPNRLRRIGNEGEEGAGRSPGTVVLGNNPGIHVFEVDRLRSLDFAASAWGEMELVPMTSGLARYFGTEEGLLVIRGPSDESIGIADGDVILAIGGRTPSSPEHAIRILASFEPGETIEFSIMRDEVRETVEYAVP